MTPKEKAEEIVFFYENLLEPYIVNPRGKAKQCATIAVDFVLNEVLRIEEEQSYGFGSEKWINIKQEIKEL